MNIFAYMEDYLLPAILWTKLEKSNQDKKFPMKAQCATSFGPTLMTEMDGESVQEVLGILLAPI